MTKDEIIRIAREAQIIEPSDPDDGLVVIEAVDMLTRFAAIAAAAEREKWPEEMKAMERQVEILTDALAKEREACAVICDSVYHQNIGPAFGEVRYGIAACSTAIRARSQS